MLNIIRVLVLAVTASLSSVAAEAQQIVLGAFLPQQSPQLDDIVRGRHANVYFMEVWRAYQRGEIAGAHTNAVIFLSTNGRTQELYRGVINGHQYVTVNRSAIQQNTALCVKIPGRFIAHQQIAAGPGTMCKDFISNDVNAGYGTSASSAIGVIATVPAGS